MLVPSSHLSGALRIVEPHPFIDLDMAHYRLIHEYTTPQFHNVCGRAFNEDGKEVAIHTSSNLAWLEQDLLRDCKYNPETDTYTKNW